ncbi:thiamine pyrophosphokinase [Teratosphaeriaceae sp. CCFEE 6253]|nr:thiamine pyrophosphokinase [Teratosphaeriaceae sp. CCFEE 6253]
MANPRQNRRHPNGEHVNGEATVELRPTQYLETRSDNTIHPDTNETAGLIILNSPISEFSYLQRLYQRTCFRVCADGGANRLYDAVTSQSESSDWEAALRSLVPDLIHGDLDSLRDTVRKRYEHIGVEVSRDPDQYSTDFGKCVKKCTELVPGVRDILVLGSVGGRVDQGIGLLHELYREQVLRHPRVRFWLFTEASVSTVLSPGTTIIHTPLSGGSITPNIGVLPLYGPATITTKGLEWDVADWVTEMGGQVSTSNHITAEQITVTTDREVIFTVERSGSE